MEAIRALYKASHTDEPARKRDIKLVGEQMSFDLGDRWGNKKRTGLSDDDRGADSIAFHEDNGTVSVWDIQSSIDGSIHVNAGDPPTFPNLPTNEATFIPCEPINHMGNGNGNGEEPPDENDDEIIAKLDEILVKQDVLIHMANQQTEILNQHTVMLQQIIDKPIGSAEPFPIIYPTYSFRDIFGRTQTMQPQPPMNPGV